jgi:hypothetical protein
MLITMGTFAARYGAGMFPTSAKIRDPREHAAESASAPRGKIRDCRGKPEIILKRSEPTSPMKPEQREADSKTR